MNGKALIILLLAATAAGNAAAEGALSSPNTTLGGQVFFDFSNIRQKSNGANGSLDGTNLDVKRFYLKVDHKFDDIWSANITTDANYVSADSETQLFIKKAYLQAKFDPALIVQLGSASLPWDAFVEKLYGYRYIEHVLTDRTKFSTTADWGLHLSGDVDHGLFNYAVSAVNGAGFKKLSRSKSVDFEGRLGFNPAPGVTLGIGGYTGKLGKDIEGVNTYHTARRANATVAYVNKAFRLGAEYFAAKNWNNVTTAASDTSDGYALWASYNVTDKISVFGRYDRVKPNKDTNPALHESYYNGGLSYSPRKDIDLALVYKHDRAAHGTLATSDYTVGGSNSGTYSEVGLFGQFSF